jgi:hypothetical protein
MTIAPLEAYALGGAYFLHQHLEQRRSKWNSEIAGLGTEAFDLCDEAACLAKPRLSHCFLERYRWSGPHVGGQLR